MKTAIERFRKQSEESLRAIAPNIPNNKNRCSGYITAH